ncbi:unnamed protein product [Lampetra fluviatilis]
MNSTGVRSAPLNCATRSWSLRWRRGPRRCGDACDALLFITVFTKQPRSVSLLDGSVTVSNGPARPQSTRRLRASSIRGSISTAVVFSVPFHSLVWLPLCS